jgi:hypothetical protein
MIIKARNLKVAIATAAYMLFFTAFYIIGENYEFLLHVFVLLSFAGLILYSDRKVKYPVWMLWALSLWGFLHMTGGAVYIGETRLYELMLVPLSQALNLFRYDQALHAYGFGVITLVFHYIIGRPKITPAIGIVVVMAGTGAGALYEIIEFLVSLVVLQHGIGGYINNSMDLIFNFIGALLALALIKWKGFDTGK